MPDENAPIGNSEWIGEFGLDLKDKVSCDTLDCDHPAVFFARVNCCGAVVIGCLQCMQKTYQTINWMRQQGKYIMCKSCNKSNDPSNWITRPEKL